LLDQALERCPDTLEPPEKIIIMRTKLPAYVRKTLNARRARREKAGANARAAAAAAAAAASSMPVASAKRRSAGGGGVSNRFGDYEGSSDSEDDGVHAVYNATERMIDMLADEDAAEAANSQSRVAKAERALARKQARAAGQANRPQAGAAAAAASAGLSVSPHPSSSFGGVMTPAQRQYFDLANFGVDDAEDDGAAYEHGGSDLMAAADGSFPTEDDPDASDPACVTNERERLKLHASMELADRRAYDAVVQHEMNETYGFADSNPRTMLLSRDSVLVKLDMMDVINNGVLQHFSDSQIETLLALLPECDRSRAGMEATFISPIFLHAMFEYQELLLTGSLDPDMREMRNVVSSKRRREQQDVWKARNYERYVSQHAHTQHQQTQRSIKVLAPSSMAHDGLTLH